MEESWLTNSGCPAARSAAEHGFLRGTQIEGKPSILRLNAEAFRPGFANRARAIFGLGPSRALDRGGHRSYEERRASRAWDVIPRRGHRRTIKVRRARVRQHVPDLTEGSRSATV